MPPTVPFKFDKNEYAWWRDRDGIAQYFRAGNSTDGIHAGVNPDLTAIVWTFH